ncbi:NUDIX hydrolase [Pseudalkalibacillus sp. Hm43]|uniref:NUDIX hydrolase n=1 Tax=Pseudalkalibacillus sp. Hm43 TaxID=3450742 RepID=UPI003F42F39A
MKKIHVASAILFDESGERVVMVKNKKEDSYFWSVPGGAVEEGETIEQAAVRETKEEAGLDIEITGLHSVRETIFQERGHQVVFFHFYGRIIGGELRSADPDNDILEVEWVDLKIANERMDYLPESFRITGPNKGIPYFYQGVV